MTTCEEAIWASAYGCAFVAVLTRAPNPSDARAQREAADYARAVAEAALGLSGKKEARVELVSAQDLAAARLAGR